MKLYLPTAACLAAMSLTQAASAVVLTGWDEWASGSEVANITDLDATGLAVETGDWRENKEAASNDGTFGTVPGADNTNLDAAKTGTMIGVTSVDGAYSFTITAGANALKLEGFHFDARRKRAGSPEVWSLDSTAGAITLANLGGGSLGNTLGGVGPSDHDDFDFDLTTLLADNILNPGESATFVLSFSGGTASNTDQKTYLDNVAITGTLASAPPIPGDTDGDGDIDDADLGTSFSNYTGPGGTGKTAADGDTDGDGDVDDGDLGVSFSAYTGPLGPAVPEPASLALLALGGLVIARRRKP